MLYHKISQTDLKLMEIALNHGFKSLYIDGAVHVFVPYTTTAGLMGVDSFKVTNMAELKKTLGY